MISALHYSPFTFSLYSVFHLSACYKQCNHSYIFLFFHSNCILQRWLLGLEIPKSILLPILCLPHKISHIWKTGRQCTVRYRRLHTFSPTNHFIHLMHTTRQILSTFTTKQCHSQQSLCLHCHSTTYQYQFHPMHFI